MDKWIGLVVALMMVTVQNVSSLGIQSESSGDTRAELNEEITLACVASGDGYSFFQNPIVWYKVVGERRLEINNNAVLKSPFLETGRYSIEADIQTNSVSIPLTISGIQPGDNGTYECEMNEGNPKKVVYHVIVPADIEKLELISNDTDELEDKVVYRIKELEPTYVKCESTGGNPTPQLHIYRGKTEITDEFDMSVQTERTGPVGLEVVTSVVRAETHNFRASWEHTGEKFKCVARIHKGPKQTVAGVLDVQYQPKFICQDSHFITLPIDMADYAIHCVIKANPQVAAGDIDWTIPDVNGSVSIVSGETSGAFTANSTLTEEGFLNVSLTINGFNQTHFNTYQLRARNSLKEKHLGIYLGEATTTTSTTAAPTPRPPVAGGYEIESAAPSFGQTAKYLPILSSLLHVLLVLITSSR